MQTHHRSYTADASTGEQNNNNSETNLQKHIWRRLKTTNDDLKVSQGEKQQKKGGGVPPQYDATTPRNDKRIGKEDKHRCMLSHLLYEVMMYKSDAPMLAREHCEGGHTPLS